LQRSGSDFRCDGACPLEQLAVAEEMGEAKIGETRLARAEQGSAAAQLEVDLGELEAVARLAERLQSGVRGLRQLLLRAGDEQAVRLLGPATDAAAELVQLREPEAVGLLDD